MRKQTKLVAALSATALLAIGASAVTFAAGWNNSTGSWQYLDNDGNPVADAWRKSGDYWFYLGSDGNMAMNEVVQPNNDFYYVNQDGAMVTNQWVAFDTTDENADHRWMYFGADGKAYRDKNDKLTISDIKNINGKKYLFDQEGYMLYGWLGEDSNLVTDDNAWETATYYYGGYDDGSAQYGWVQLPVLGDDGEETHWFYFDSNGKVQRNKKKTINGATYYFDEKGRMIEDWSSASKTTRVTVSPSFTGKVKPTDSIVYVNGDGGARKNQWVWAVPTEDYDDEDYYDDSASWWWADNSGKVVVDTIKKIKGKTYAFDRIGRMVSGLQKSSTGRDGFSGKSGVGTASFQGLSGEDYLTRVNLSAGENIYFFSDDYEKDGSRKSGYQKVNFDDDTYQMYFNNNGTAAHGYVNKIKKYCNKGIILAANNDDSNYGYIEVLSTDVKKLADDHTVVLYATGNGASVGDNVLVNTAGTVQKGKFNLKDSNDVYYVTDNAGKIIYEGSKKLFSSKSDAHPNQLSYTINGKTYWTE